MAGTPHFDEVDLKRPFWVSSAVDARLRETFAGEDAPRAGVLLVALMGDDPHDDEASDQAQCRLLLAALKVAEGDLARLAAAVELGRTDPRDLIAAAEYRREIVAGLDASDRDRDLDLDEYLLWVSGGAVG